MSIREEGGYKRAGENWENERSVKAKTRFWGKDETAEQMWWRRTRWVK